MSSAGIKLDNQKNIQALKRQRLNGEEVNGQDARSLGLKEL